MTFFIDSITAAGRLIPARASQQDFTKLTKPGSAASISIPSADQKAE
jgi:hypothetical protein